MKNKSVLIIAGILATLFLSWWLLSHFFKEDKSKHRFRIGIDTSWVPLQVYHSEQNLSYFSEELLSSIAENQNFSARIIPTESEFLISGLLRGDFDAILSLSPIPSRYDPKNFIFSNTYFPLGPVVVTSKTSRIKSLKDISGKKIGFIIGSEAAVPYKDSTIRFVAYDNADLPRLIDNLLDDHIDGAILKAMLAYHYAERGIYQNVLEIVTLPLNNDGLALIAKNNPEAKILIKMFDDGLKALQENGTYNQLLQKWDFPLPKNPTP